MSWQVGDLLSVIDVENIPAELLLLGGARLSMGTMFQAAGGPANFSKVILRNPVGSGAIARVIGFNAFTSSGNIVFGPTQNTDVAGGDRAFNDTRVFGEGTVCILEGNNNLLATGSAFWNCTVDAQGSYEWALPPALGVMAPGGGFEVTAGTVDQVLRVNWLWLERTAEPSELNL